MRGKKRTKGPDHRRRPILFDHPTKQPPHSNFKPNHTNTHLKTLTFPPINPPLITIARSEMEAQEKQKHTHTHTHLSSPQPTRTPSIFKDISNFKTPKSTFSKPQTPNHFFTASKQTPKTSNTLRRPRASLAPPSHSKLAASRRLKAFEIEQSKSARKAQIAKENSLKSLASSLSAWLNFLFENPRACGCDIGKLIGEDEVFEVAVSRNGKRDSVESGEVVFDRMWRGSKRQRDELWCNKDGKETTLLSNSMFLELRESLKEVCSFDDLKERMGVYLSLGSCKEIFDVMTRVTKVCFEF